MVVCAGTCFEQAVSVFFRYCPFRVQVNTIFSLTSIYMNMWKVIAFLGANGKGADNHAFWL